MTENTQMQTNRVSELRMLCLQRGMNSEMLDSLTDRAVETIGEFLGLHKGARINRISGKGNYVFEDTACEYVYVVSKNEFAGETAKMLPAEEFGSRVAELILQEYPFASAAPPALSSDGKTLIYAFRADQFDIEPLTLPASGLFSEDVIESTASRISAEPKSTVKKEAVAYLNEAAEKIRKELGISAREIARIGQTAQTGLISEADAELLKLLIAGKITTGDLRKKKRVYTVGKTGQQVNPAEMPPRNVENKLRETAKKLMTIARNMKKYTDALDYLHSAGCRNAVMDENLIVRADFGDLGTAEVDPQASYKRALRSWMKNQEIRLNNIQKEKEKKIMALPMFGQIIPYVILTLISHSRHDLTETAICKIMRGMRGVSFYYSDADDFLEEWCDSEDRFNAVNDEAIKSGLSALLRYSFAARREVKGDYGYFYVYFITEKGSEFLDLMERKGKSRGQFASLRRLQKKFDPESAESCIKTTGEIIRAPEYAGMCPELLTECAGENYARVKDYLDLELSLSDDENEKKTIRKLKKLMKKYAQQKESGN